MSIGGDDGITLPKITKCADIRKKNRHIEFRHRGVFYVVIAKRIRDKQLKAAQIFIPDLNFSIPDPGSKRFRIPIKELYH